MFKPPFHDRTDAGRRLGEALQHLSDADPVVLGLPRGGVPVAAEVARALAAPLDVIVVQKACVPQQLELALGAAGENGVRVLNPAVIQALSIRQGDLREAMTVAAARVDQRVRRLREGGPGQRWAGRTVVIVDDGAATGATARAACRVGRARGAARVVLALPVASPGALAMLAEEADDVIVLEKPEEFDAVGAWYDAFAPTTDDEVAALLASYRDEVRAEQDVTVRAGAEAMRGHLTSPEAMIGLVILGHEGAVVGPDPRIAHALRVLQRRGFGTLVIDLVAQHGDPSPGTAADAACLGGRLAAAARWAGGNPLTFALPIGLAGAGRYAAAAMWAAADLGSEVTAVASWGGRPDLVGRKLSYVTAPTLLIVGRLDTEVLKRNVQGRKRLRCRNRLTVVPGAGHGFDEPGKRDVVAQAVAGWFADPWILSSAAESIPRLGADVRRE